MTICQTWMRSTLIAFAVVLAAGAQACFAQDTTGTKNEMDNRSSSKLASHEKSPAGEAISFQLRDWKQMHFHNAQEAEKHLKTVEQLGCVAKKDQHGDHIDVRYHCLEWKSITLETQDAAKQWHDWLVSAGFDVFRPNVDPTFATGAESVQFRLTEFKAVHGDGSAEQQQFVDTLKKVGCDVRVTDHNGHSDIRFRAPTWCTIRVADEAAANQWREWLTSQGFEAKLANRN